MQATSSYENRRWLAWKGAATLVAGRGCEFCISLNDGTLCEMCLEMSGQAFECKVAGGGALQPVYQPEPQPEGFTWRRLKGDRQWLQGSARRTMSAGGTQGSASVCPGCGGTFFSSASSIASRM